MMLYPIKPYVVTPVDSQIRELNHIHWHNEVVDFRPLLTPSLYHIIVIYVRQGPHPAPLVDSRKMWEPWVESQEPMDP